jgi:predicted PurR-regulated permease PerM
MLGVLLSLYLGAVANWIERKTRAPEGIALAAAIFGSLALLALLLWSLAPPVIDQTRKLIADMPKFIASWEAGIDGLASRFPALRDVVGPPGEHRTVHALYEQLSGFAGTIPTKIFEFVHAAINIFAVGVMGIYLALHPALYREWLIALFPPIHRDLVRDVLHDLADSLRSYIVGQILAMTFLGILTAIGLYVLNVPFWLPFGIFTGLVAIIPFFGTLMSTTLPALFVLTGSGYYGFTPLGHALLVVGLGVVVHLVEGNVVAPLVMSKKVDLPPVLTIISVLIIGQLLGGLGLIVALPTLATLMVIVRRILITRIYEGQGFRRTSRERPLVLRVPAPGGGQGFRRTSRERPLVLRVPAPGGGVLAHPGAPVDMITAAEREGLKRSA